MTHDTPSDEQLRTLSDETLALVEMGADQVNIEAAERLARAVLRLLEENRYLKEDYGKATDGILADRDKYRAKVEYLTEKNKEIVARFWRYHAVVDAARRTYARQTDYQARWAMEEIAVAIRDLDDAEAKETP